jgi:DNA-binding MarR family transcriptional regulator
MNNNQKTNKFTHLLLQIRAWEDANFRLGGSLLVKDILTIVAHHTISNTPLTLKQLHMLLDFSEAGIRKQLRNLISQGWIDLRPSKDDGRLKIVFATPRLIKTIQAFELEWEKLSESL